MAGCSKRAARSRRIQGGGVAAGDLVFAEHLQELEMAELAGMGLGEAGVEGVQHAGQLQGAQRRLQLVAAGHRRVPGGIAAKTGLCSVL